MGVIFVKKILLIDDMDIVHDSLREKLNGNVEIISAKTISEAKQLFQENPNVDAIIMDACVPGEEINTLPLVREFRETYSGLMIAISTDGDYQKQLVDAGCNDRCKNKRLLAEYLTELLHL